MFNVFAAAPYRCSDMEGDECDDRHKRMGVDVQNDHHQDVRGHGNISVERGFCPGLDPDIVTDAQRCRVAIRYQIPDGGDVV